MPALTSDHSHPRHDSPHAPYDSSVSVFAPLPTLPPPIAHKLWILDCKSCGAFLTNRGMKAVLLLRPHVSLFSTDALPINCSAYSSNPDALRPSICQPSSFPRTCECLTQTLCCHRCGASVGYMIVHPCARCTSSITATNRATNGHRFVFHSSELIATERHYIQDEPGVIPYDIPVPTSRFFFQPPQTQPHARSHAYPLHTFSGHPGSLSSSPDYVLTPPLVEFADVSQPATPFPVPFGQVSSLRFSDRDPSHHPVVPSQSPIPIEHKDFPPLRRLRPGDVLFWHHLAPNGEIPGVEDDVRARAHFSGIFDR